MYVSWDSLSLKILDNVRVKSTKLSKTGYYSCFIAENPTWIECSGPAEVCEPHPQLSLRAIHTFVQGLTQLDITFEWL